MGRWRELFPHSASLCSPFHRVFSGFLRFSYQYGYDADCGDCDLSSDFESGRRAEDRRRGDAERGKIPQKKELKAREQVEKEKIHQYQFTGKPETKRLYKGDQILVPAKQGKGNIVLTVGGTLGNFSILTPSGNQIVELSEERDIDIDGDGFADLIIYLSDVSNDNEANGAEVRILEKSIENSFVAISDGKSGTELSEIPAASAVKNNANRTVIHEDTRAYPFTINVTFRGSCLFRYKSDRQDYVEGYYKSGELVTITSNNGTRLWMSNINALKIHVIAGLSSYDLEVGRAGEVQAEDIKWVRDSDGKYRLVVLELD